MDWVTVVFIVIFFVLPVIQQLLEARRGRRGEGDKEVDPEQEWEPIQIEGPAGGEERRPPRGVPLDSSNQSWSEGWRTWPEPVQIEAPAEERAPLRSPVPRPSPVDTSEGWRRAEERPAPTERIERPRPLPDRQRGGVAAPVPELVRRPPPTEVVRARERFVTPTPRQPSRPATATPARRPPPVVSRLGSSTELRQAILLREILGPPRALQSDEPGRTDLV